MSVHNPTVTRISGSNLAARGKSRHPGIDAAGRVFYTGGHGDGYDSRRRVSAIDVGGDDGSAAERGASLLRATEPDSERGWLRRVRGGTVRAVLHDDGSAESGAGTLLPVAASRVLRGAGLGTGDRVAGGRFAEPACVSALGSACGASGPFDDLADAAAVSGRDASGGVHVGVAAVGGCRFGSREDGGHRCDDPGSECGDAEHRAS